MDKHKTHNETYNTTAENERVVYSDGTIAHIFTDSEAGGYIPFGGSHTYIPSIPQSPRVSEPMIIETVDGIYAVGMGVIVDSMGVAYDISEIGTNVFPKGITIGQEFEIPGVIVTPRVTAFGVKHSMSYIDPDNIEGLGVEKSPFREVAGVLADASKHFNNVYPDRQSIRYGENGEVYVNKHRRNPSLASRLGGFITKWFDQ